MYSDSYDFIKDSVHPPKKVPDVKKNNVKQIYYDGNKIDSISNAILTEFNNGNDKVNEHILQFDLKNQYIDENGEKHPLLRFTSLDFRLDGQSLL